MNSISCGNSVSAKLGLDALHFCLHPRHYTFLIYIKKKNPKKKHDSETLQLGCVSVFSPNPCLLSQYTAFFLVWEIAVALPLMEGWIHLPDPTQRAFGIYDDRCGIQKRQGQLSHEWDVYSWNRMDWKPSANRSFSSQRKGLLPFSPCALICGFARGNKRRGGCLNDFNWLISMSLELLEQASVSLPGRCLYLL